MSVNKKPLDIRVGYDAKKLCWFNVGGVIQRFFKPNSLDELVEFIHSESYGEQPIKTVGAGSNIIFSDGEITDTVIRLGRGFNYINHEVAADGRAEIRVGAATLDLNLALYCRDNGIAGLEFFAGIPGTIGGAIAMNAGAYGTETQEYLAEFKAINSKTGEIKTFKRDEVDFGYRHNPLEEGWIYVEAKFVVPFGDREEIGLKIKEIQSKRSTTQPIKTKTGGSTFKNPEGNSAWKLVDEAGCRGLRVGGCHISQLHCNFIVNDQDATATDIIQLVELVKSKVKAISGVELEAEIKVI